MKFFKRFLSTNTQIIPNSNAIIPTAQVLTEKQPLQLGSLHTTHLFTDTSKWNEIDPALLDCYTRLYEYRIAEVKQKGRWLSETRFQMDSKSLIETLSQFTNIIHDTPLLPDLRDGLKRLNLALHQMSTNLRSSLLANRTELLVLLADFQGENKEFTDGIDIARQRMSSTLKRTSFTFSEGTSLNRFNILSIIGLGSASVVLAAFTEWSVIEGIWMDLFA